MIALLVGRASVSAVRAAATSIYPRRPVPDDEDDAVGEPPVRTMLRLVDLRREFSNSCTSAKSLVRRLLRRVEKGSKVAPEAPVPVFEDARGANVRVLRQAQRRLSPAELQALIAEYEAGARVGELAKVYDLHRTTVAKHVARAGKTRPVMTVAQIDEAVLLYRDGWTLHNVGQHLGVADQTIRRVLVERTVTIRPGGRQKVAVAA